MRCSATSICDGISLKQIHHDTTTFVSRTNKLNMVLNVVFDLDILHKPLNLWLILHLLHEQRNVLILHESFQLWNFIRIILIHFKFI